jgi:hypothetical protein
MVTVRILVGRVMLTRPTAMAALKTAITSTFLAGLLVVGALAGCSYSGRTTSGSAAKESVTGASDAFCSFVTRVNAISVKAASQQQGLQLLATLMPKMQRQSAAAPAAVAADFNVVATAAQLAITQHDLTLLATDQVATAGTSLTTYCHSRS